MNKTMRCPTCGNYVTGKIKRSTGSKLTRDIVKKGGMKAIGFTAGSILPGLGNIVGFAAGALADSLMGEKINKEVDGLVDNFMTDDTYEFVCPKCGKKWAKKFSAAGSSYSQSYGSSYSTSQGSSHSCASGSSRGAVADDLQLLKLICQYAKNKPGNVSATIGAAGIKWNGLVSRLNSDYGLHIYEHQLPHSGQIKDLIKMIQVLAGGGSRSASQTASQSTIRDSSSHSCVSGSSRGAAADDFQLLKLICQYAKNKPGNVSATIGAAGIKWNGLVSRLNSDYGLHIYEHQLPHSGQIKDLIKMIQVLAGGGSCSASQTASQSTIRDSVDVENDAFYKEFENFVNQIETIVESKSSALDYINKIHSLAIKTKDPVVKSEYKYLQTLCCLHYNNTLLKNDSTLISEGLTYIDNALDLLNDDEYKVIKLIFQSHQLIYETSELDLLAIKQRGISDNCPIIFNIQNTLLDVKYLQALYGDARFESLNDSFEKLENANMHVEAVSILKEIHKLDFSDYKVYSADLLGQYCLFGEEGFLPDPKTGFKYVCNAIGLIDHEVDFDEKDKFHLAWRNCITNVAHCYYTGLGTNVDYEKAYTFAMKGAELGDEAAMETLGQLYEHGKGVTQNQQTALEWYQKAADLGNEDAKKRLKELALTKADGLIASKPVGSAIIDAKRTDGLSEAEQEYLDELKACLEDDAEISPRERRLLERLRTNLGISDVRAAELEASLSQPVLTEAEKEYLSEYQECATDGIISDKERRLLDKLRNVLGISEERAKKLESIELNNRINY